MAPPSAQIGVSMSKPERGVASDRPQRATELIDVAAQRMAELGYDRTTVRDIATDMGLTSGSIFYHFRNKEELLEAIIRKGIVDGIAFVGEMITPDLRPVSRFHRLVRAHLRMVHGDLSYVHRVWTYEWAKLSQEARDRLRVLNDEYTEMWRETLRRLHDAGHLRSNPDFARHLLLPALNWSSKWVHAFSEAEEEKLSDQVCSVVLNCSVEDFKRLHRADG